MKYNDIIVNSKGEKERIIGVVDEVIITVNRWEAKQRLIEEGWKVEKQEFVPKEGNNYWYLDSSGKAKNCNWNNDYIDKFLLKSKNVFRTKEEAEERYDEIMKGKE